MPVYLLTAKDGADWVGRIALRRVTVVAASAGEARRLAERETRQFGTSRSKEPGRQDLDPLPISPWRDPGATDCIVVDGDCEQQVLAIEPEQIG